MKCSAKILVSTLCLSMLAGAPMAEAQAEKTEMPSGVSISSPEFETAIDTAPAGSDLSKWSDREIFSHYQSEIDNINFWLDEIERSELALLRLHQDMAAFQKGIWISPRVRMSGLTCLAIAIENEAGGEPAAGKAATAETIITRARGNPSRICSVVFARGQYEGMKRRARQPTAETMRIAHAAIQHPKACGFDHFINKALQLKLGRRIPAWVFAFERRGCRHAKIGKHDYYSSCDCKYRFEGDEYDFDFEI